MRKVFSIAAISVLLLIACSGSGESDSADSETGGSVTTISVPGGEPDGITVTETGDIFYTDIESGEVSQVTPEGETVIIADLGDQSHPDGLTSVTESDSTIIYIAETGSEGHDSENYSTDGSITQITVDSNGNVTENEFVDSAVLESPTGIAVDNDGNLYVADQGSGDIYKIPVTDGVAAAPESLTDNGTAGAGVSIDEPHGLAIQTNEDGSVTLYTTDQAEDSNNIVKIEIPVSGETSEAEISNVTPKNAGGDNGDTVDTAEFNNPHGIAVDSNGAIIVSDENNNKVQIITPDGKVITIAGNGTPGDTDGEADNAQFNGPRGIAVDNEGNILVCDCENGKIKKIER